MPQPEQAYTYRSGRKIALEKSPDQFVVRASPERLEEEGIENAERVSSASSRVTTLADDLEPMMSVARGVATTHHAYYDAETGQEFLITDRVIVTFKLPPMGRGQRELPYQSRGGSGRPLHPRLRAQT